MKRIFVALVWFFVFSTGVAQERSVQISSDMFRSHDRIYLAPLDGWIFQNGSDPNWANPEWDVSDWQELGPTHISPEWEDESGRIEGWFRIRIKLDDSMKGIPLSINRELWAATDVYLDGMLVHSFGHTGKPYKAYNPILKYPIPIDLEVGRDYILAFHFVDYESTFTQREIRLTPGNLQNFINLTGPAYASWVTYSHKLTHIFVTLCISVSFLLFFLYWFLVYLNPDQTTFRLIAWFTTAVMIGTLTIFGNYFFEIPYGIEKIRFVVSITFQAIMVIFGLFVLEMVLTHRISRISWAILIILLVANVLAHVFSISFPFGILFVVMVAHFGRKFLTHVKAITGAKWAILAGSVIATIATVVYITLHKYDLDLYNEYDKLLLSTTILATPLFLLAYISVRFKETLQAEKEEAQKVLEISEEKKEILANQNLMLEKQVNERTLELKNSLETLKSTQAQLIQSEKMASLGELTAGIAHEIQNPLNFVNNFAEVSEELIEEMEEEISKGELEEVKAIGTAIKENLNKIHYHGKRADAIVKSMLQHSRRDKGKKEPVNLNQLADEYLRLSYHGLRAKDKSFFADFHLEIDENLPLVEVAPQEIGRVLLNLINNAFYAVSEKKKLLEESGKLGDFRPHVLVSTQKVENGVEISVKDNGNGISEDIKSKIFQPFFTTKPAGSGTGLGLSMSYDIVKVHGGDLNVASEIGESTEFTITLPLSS